MHILMPLLLTLVQRPYAAVSKPTLQAWSRFKRGRLSQRFLAADGSLRAVAGGAVDAPVKSEELREQAAAKFKEANDLIEEACKEAGITVDQLHDGEGDVSAETLAKFDELMNEGRELAAEHMKVAKAEGRWTGFRDAMDFYHGKATGGPVPWEQVHVQTIERPKSLGEEFVDSEVYEALKKSGVLHQEKGAFRTEGVSILNDLRIKAENGDKEAVKALKAATDLIHSESGGPGNALVLPQFLAGILGLPQRPLVIRELFGDGTTTSDSISYGAAVGFDDAAAAVAQATSISGETGRKPQSSISWERRTALIESIATWFAVTRQQIADVGQIQSLIDQNGRLMLQLEEEDQLLSGNGTPPNLDGLLSISGVQTFDVAAATLDPNGALANLKSIRRAKRLVATGTGRNVADAVVMNPYDSEQFDMLMDANAVFRGGNPIGNFAFGQSIWGLRRVESEAIPLGRVIVGAFRAGATVLERQPITVYTTDSHSDWFTRNLIAILFEERLGFPVFFPASFVDITLDQSEDWGT